VRLLWPAGSTHAITAQVTHLTRGHERRAGLTPKHKSWHERKNVSHLVDMVRFPN